MPRLSPPSSSWLHSLVPGSSPFISISAFVWERRQQRERETGRGICEMRQVLSGQSGQSGSQWAGRGCHSVSWAGQWPGDVSRASPHPGLVTCVTHVTLLLATHVTRVTRMWWRDRDEVRLEAGWGVTAVHWPAAVGSCSRGRGRPPAQTAAVLHITAALQQLQAGVCDPRCMQSPRSVPCSTSRSNVVTLP